MSADVWLQDEHGEPIVHTDDPDAQMRDVVPMRCPGQVTATGFNLTYNLTGMLAAAGMPPWQDLLGQRAADAGTVWRAVHAALVADPDRFRGHNPENGWGTYEDAVEVIGALADACERHPQATVGGWL